MTDMIFLDSGVRVIGYALFEDYHLLSAGVSKVSTKLRHTNDIVHKHVENFRDLELKGDYVVEGMEFRPADTWNRCGDLLRAQVVSLAVAGAMSEDAPQIVYVSEWKKPIPKEIHHPRILKALSEAEKSIVDLAFKYTPKTNHKEIIDAIGIGLWFTRRIERGGVCLT